MSITYPDCLTLTDCQAANRACLPLILTTTSPSRLWEALHFNRCVFSVPQENPQPAESLPLESKSVHCLPSEGIHSNVSVTNKVHTRTPSLLCQCMSMSLCHCYILLSILCVLCCVTNTHTQATPFPLILLNKTSMPSKVSFPVRVVCPCVYSVCVCVGNNQRSIYLHQLPI